jgi:hypothetical protein
MTDLPTPERRAVLRSQATSRSGCNPIIKQNELLALLDATEPTQDAEVAHALLEAKASNHQRMQGRTNVFDAELVQELAALLTRQARELAEARATTWRPIESAPRNVKERTDYVLISDGVCVPDIAIWQGERPARTINGNYHHPVPQGWFSINQGRSRLDGKATKWMPLPQEPKP